MGSGMNCDHWRHSCSKCGRTTHSCNGTSQCRRCRKSHYRFDWGSMEPTFVFYRDTRYENENRIQRDSARFTDMEYRGFIGSDLGPFENAELAARF